MDRKEMQNTRLYLLAFLLVLALAAYLFVLYDAQVIHYDEYAAQAIRSIVRTEKVEASRGIITDRNGKPLVSNRSTYDLTFDAALLSPEDDSNEAILRLVQLCQEEGVAWSDNLPISRYVPYRYTVDQLDSQQKRRFLTYVKSLRPCGDALAQYLLRHPEAVSTPEPEPEEGAEVPETLTPEERANRLLERLVPGDLTAELLVEAGITPAKLMDLMRGELNIPEDYTLSQARMVLGVQYELSVRKLDNYEAYVLAEDIGTPFISLLSDGNYAGAKVTLSSVREYETTYAAHILGYVGKIGSPEEFDRMKEKGYEYDDLVGKEGAELAFDDYLKGQDGWRMVATNNEGKVTGEFYSTEPEPGNIVELTIDLDFQAQVEGFLEETVTRLNADGDEKRGAGAAVVRVGTGEVLSLASYPSFDLSTFRQGENYAAVSSDPQAPLFNRAAVGSYPPGSTLKPFTAMAALLEEKVTLKEKIRDTGIWRYPGDEANSYAKCWKTSGHGNLNVSGAITNSCNYFFAELGFRMGMDTLRERLLQFGLGEKTGIEIPETAGLLPENPQGQNQAPWAAFGQSSQLYSPLQLANYIATLVSGGKHCQAHLLKAAKTYDNSAVVAMGNTEPLNTIDISDENLRAVKEGMKGLVEGTLSPYFRNCVVSAGAKTGTSQVRADTKNHGVFVCFAPYDDPEIAVAIAIERADAGAALASTAVNILNAYFTPNEDSSTVTGENQLLP
ncbi:penicillin-binding transpeptidase domain-containing protein [uncultured Oscillibacter sp.]|jgi:penicillin-binding protein 2|uniref:penicillin-binding transpeptidase domain-containing protein n=1 Tax=uncultured Oscillibacter sp. TaxID=876091 RepID=UPI00216EAC85|nr:penicillin-binding transpeptidase domain-containing protein [uncultured Oscillibacter sp.]MCI9553895.1 penicillin-binding protein A [Oscillibacter sp.]